jgi:hypothetical protein
MIRLLITLLKKERPNVRYVQANSEADLVIRYIAREYDGKKLIQSADTDYYFLFADDPDVNVTVFTGHPIYNPNQIWKDYIGITDMQYISRIGPILGNDFTLHESLMYANQHPRDLLNLLGLEDTNIGARKKLFKIVRNIKVGSLIPVTKLDELIESFNPKYYVNYKNSSIIYLDLENNTDYTEFDGCLKTEFEYLFKKLNMRNFYEWDSSLILSDKNAFINEALEYEIEDVDTFIVEVMSNRILDTGPQLECPEDQFFK